MLPSGSHRIANKNRSLLVQLLTNPFATKNREKLNINYND